MSVSSVISTSSSTLPQAEMEAQMAQLRESLAKTQAQLYKVTEELARKSEEVAFTKSVVFNNKLVKDKYDRQTTPAEKEQYAIIVDLTYPGEHYEPADPTNPEHIKFADQCNVFYASRGGVCDEWAGAMNIKDTFLAMPLNELKALHAPLKSIFSAARFINTDRPEIVRGFLHASSKCSTAEQKKKVWQDLSKQLHAIVGHSTNSHDLTWALNILRSTFDLKSDTYRVKLIDTAYSFYTGRMNSVSRVYILNGLDQLVTALKPLFPQINWLDTLQNMSLKGKESFVRICIPKTLQEE